VEGRDKGETKSLLSLDWEISTGSRPHGRTLLKLYEEKLKTHIQADRILRIKRDVGGGGTRIKKEGAQNVRSGGLS